MTKGRQKYRNTSEGENVVGGGIGSGIECVVWYGRY